MYAHALTIEQISVFLEQARVEFSNNDPQRWTEWLFGDKKKGIPRWAGYTLGYYLIGEYLKTHPDQKPSTLYAAPAEEFIK